MKEELYTDNAKYRMKFTELADANDAMNSGLASQAGVLFVDDDLCLRGYTPEIAKLLHLVPQDIGCNITSFSQRIIAEGWIANIEQAVTDNAEIEREVKSRDGTTCLLRIAPCQQQGGKRGVVLSLIAVEEQATSSQTAYIFRHMSERTADLHVLLNRDGQVQYVNPAMAQATGYSVEDLIGQPFKLLDPHFGRARTAEIFDHAEAHPDLRFESTLHRVDATIFPVEVTACSIQIGKQTLLFASARDIAKQRASRDQLNLYESAIAVSNNGIAIADAQADDIPLIYVNSGFSKMTGYAAAEVIGKNCRFLQGKDTNTKTLQRIRKAIAAGKPTRVTLRNYRKDGQAFWNDLTVNPLTDSSGRVTHFIGVLNDVSSVFNKRLQAREEAARLKTLMNSTAEGIYGLDTSGNCTFINTPAIKMLGYTTQAEVLGKNMHTLVHHTYADGGPYPMEDCQIARSHQFAEDVHLSEEVLWRADNTSFPVDYYATPLIVDGKIRGSVVTFTDISERINREAELISARARADSANRAKTEFLANMSHEIRTPLAAVMAYSELLERSATSDLDQKRIAAIRRNSQHLIDIVDDILDLSRIEADKLEIKQDTTDIARLVLDLQSMMEMRAKESGIGFHFDTGSEIPSLLLIDTVRLRQVLINLIGNAIKFTEQGNVTVTLSYLAPNLTVQVHDTGIGIEADKLSVLFEAFEQADTTIERRFGGTGLGLNISKRLVERMGGEITVDSSPGAGSTFTLVIPAPADANATTMANVLAVSQYLAADARKISPLPEHSHILLADDHHDVRNAITEILEQAGAHIEAVGDGQQALDKARSTNGGFDAIVLDIEMPKINGLLVATTLREQGITTPLLALTAQAMSGERERCLAAGFDEYLSKPIDAITLTRVVAQLMHDSSERQHNSALANTAERQNVLLIDDHLETCTALAELLARNGRDIRIAQSSADARAVLAAFIPSVVLLDVNLGADDGIELLTEIKTASAMQNTRFVALTGLAADSDRQRLLTAGFDEFLAKPVDSKMLDDLIDRLHSA